MSQEFVENVLAVHRKYRTLIQDVFQGDQAFVGALDKACTAVINHRPPKQPAKAPELVNDNSKIGNYSGLGGDLVYVHEFYFCLRPKPKDLGIT